jgi:hypothetical protein
LRSFCDRCLIPVRVTKPDDIAYLLKVATNFGALLEVSYAAPQQPLMVTRAIPVELAREAVVFLVPADGNRVTVPMSQLRSMEAALPSLGTEAT